MGQGQRNLAPKGRPWLQSHRTEPLTRSLCSLGLGLGQRVSPPLAASYLLCPFLLATTLSLSNTMHIPFQLSYALKLLAELFPFADKTWSVFSCIFCPPSPFIPYSPSMSSSYPHHFAVTSPLEDNQCPSHRIQ